MNLIRIYGELKYAQAILKYDSESDFTDLYDYKLNRLIEIVEYKLGLITQDEMSEAFFNEKDDKDSWVMHTFTHNYQRDKHSCHYYRKCFKCGYKWYCLHSRYECKKRSCGCKSI